MSIRSQWTAAVMVALFLAGEAAGQGEVNRRYTETSLGPFPPEVRESAVLSPDGRHVAYIQSGADRRVVLDGQPQKPFDRVAGLEFSRDGTRLAYAAKRGDRWYVVSDGRESPGYERVGLPHFSADGAKLAFVALLDVGKRTVVVNGQAGPSYDVISGGLIAFSPAGARMAYGAVRDGKCYLVSNGEEMGPFDDLGTRTGYRFSPDGARLAFVALVGEDLHVVFDGRRSPPAYDVGEVIFSPDGKQVAYTAQETEGGPWFVFRHNEKQGPFETIGDGSLQFSPGGARLAYAARTKGRWSLVYRRPARRAPRGNRRDLFQPGRKTSGLRVPRRRLGGGRDRRPGAKGRSTRSGADRSSSVPTAAGWGISLAAAMPASW